MLRKQMSSLTEIEPVVVLAWVVGASWGEILPNGEENIHLRGPHWGVGFDSRARLPAEEVFELNGVPIAFGVPASKMQWLDGATLDFIGGKFEVTKRAI